MTSLVVLSLVALAALPQGLQAFDHPQDDTPPLPPELSSNDVDVVADQQAVQLAESAASAAETDSDAESHDDHAGDEDDDDVQDPASMFQSMLALGGLCDAFITKGLSDLSQRTPSRNSDIVDSLTRLRAVSTESVSETGPACYPVAGRAAASAAQPAPSAAGAPENR